MQENSSSGTQLATRKAQLTTLESYLADRSEVLARVAGDVLDPRRLIRLALGNATRVPQLLQCTPRSWVMALMDAAFYGLEPNPLLGHAYLVPFENKKVRPSQLEVQLIVGYKGYILLACESKAVDDIDADIVYAREIETGRFKEARHKNPPFVHEPLPPPARGKPVGAYAVGWRDVGAQRAVRKFTYLHQDDIDRYRQRSRAAASGKSPWSTDTLAMWKKTAIRRMVSFLPLRATSKLGVSLAQDAALERTGLPVHVHEFDEQHGEVRSRVDELGEVHDDPEPPPSEPPADQPDGDEPAPFR